MLVCRRTQHFVAGVISSPPGDRSSIIEEVLNDRSSIKHIREGLDISVLGSHLDWAGETPAYAKTTADKPSSRVRSPYGYFTHPALLRNAPKKGGTSDRFKTLPACHAPAGGGYPISLEAPRYEAYV